MNRTETRITNKLTYVLSLSAVFKYIAKQAVDRNMAVTVKSCVILLCMHPTPLSGYSKITVNVF